MLYRNFFRFLLAGKVRLATLELAIMVLNMLVVMDDGTSCLHDNHLATLMATREESMALLRNVFKTEEMILDMFEDEYREMSVSGHGIGMSSFSWDTTACKSCVSIAVVISLVAN